MYKSIQALFICLTVILSGISCGEEVKDTDSRKDQEKTPPNIVVIYLDDLGYGDVSAYGATEISTPNIDKLAKEGLRFTNGYAAAATCTPSRYSLLTGVYPWRNKDAKILPGTAPLLIDTAQMTIPKMLRKKGYYTGVVGKWHLGLGAGNVDWNRHIAPGPNEVGFDYAYIMAATQDRVPTVFIENGYVAHLDPSDPIEVSYQHNFPGQPTGRDNPELLKMMWDHGHDQTIVNGISRIGYMKGGETAKWVDENMADTFLVRAQQYVTDHRNQPFFLYYALQQPHVPRTPHDRFVGKTGMGPRGDAIIEADWCIGEFMKTLEGLGLLENTLVVLSSDNGPVVNDGYKDESIEKLEKHTPAGVLRGGKYSLFDAGTRVPFITYWSGHINPGVSDAMISQVDFLSSFAELAGSDQRTPDSEQLLDVLLGKQQTGRKEIVLEATSRTAMRQGDWVLIPPYPGPAVNKFVNIELGNSSEYQLYNLKDDISQKHNLATSNPEKLQQMIADFERIRGNANENVEALELK
ncbi:MAG: arylsulfatase [Saprospiraceae bacterium]|nr:arylsulfatase [Saprospiraceae bacterium]